MNIGFDIDGVLTNLEKFQIEYGRKFFKRLESNCTGVGVLEMFECTEQEEYAFWKRYLFFYSLKYPMREGCRDVLKKIAKEGNRIYIITSRIISDEKSILGALMRILVRRFLKGIPIEKIIFCSITNSAKEKYDACLQYNIDVMVEDTPDNLYKLKEITTVICFDAKYNRELSDDIIRVSTFNEIYCFVNRRNSETGFRFLKESERELLNEDDLKQYYENMHQYYRNNTMIKRLEKTEKFYMFLYPVLSFLLRMRYPYKIIHQERLPKDNGAIYIANHRDQLDPPLVMAVVGRKPVHLLPFVLKKIFFLKSKQI